jgi:hypothetical protein
MWVSLTILGSIILILVALAFYSINSRRPKFFRGELNPFEKSLYKALENKIGAAGQLIPLQLNYLNRGVRLYFEKSYTLELYQNKENLLPKDILFNRKDEFKLSTLGFSHNKTKYTATFKTNSGMLYALTVKPNPKRIFGKEIHSFEKFTIHNDPTEKLDLEVDTEYFTASDKITGILEELMSKYKIINIQKPLPEKQQQLFTKLSETKLPEDYLLLCNQTNGFEIDEATVFGLGNIEQVSLDDDNHLILAEHRAGCLVIKQSKRPTKLKYQSYEDATDIRDLDYRFLKALEIFMKIE